MSFGVLGDYVIIVLFLGLGWVGGMWMNMGEGGLLLYYLKGNVDIIF